MNRILLALALVALALPAAAQQRGGGGGSSGGGLTNPLATGTSPPALYSNSSDGGFGFDASSNLPEMVGTSIGVNAALVPSAGFDSGDGGLLVSGPGDGGFVVMAVTPSTGTGAPELEVDGFGFDDAPAFELYASGGTVESPTAVTSNEILGGYYFGGYDGNSSYGDEAQYIQGLASENWDASHHGTILRIITTDSNTETTTGRFGIDGATGDTDVYQNLIVAEQVSLPRMTTAANCAAGPYSGGQLIATTGTGVVIYCP